MSPVLAFAAGAIAWGLLACLIATLFCRVARSGQDHAPVEEVPAPARPAVVDRTRRPGDGDDGREVTSP